MTRTRMKRIDADEIEYQYIKIVLLFSCLVVLLFVILIQSTKSQNNNIKHLNFRKLFSNERTLDASHFVEGLSCGFDLDYNFFSILLLNQLNDISVLDDWGCLDIDVR